MFYFVGRLPNTLIDKLQVYYGLVIRRNVGNLSAMKQEIFAVLYHSASSDANPHHDSCL